MENKFIFDSFLQAAQCPTFQHRWMMVETWAELVDSHYQIPDAAGFNGEKLKNVPKHYKWPNTIIESKGAVKDSVDLYVNNYRPKGGKQCHCYYADTKGQYPSGENAGQEWYLKIQKDLLNLKVTRSATLTLQASTKDGNGHKETKRPSEQEYY
jgi:hypothetical protein